MNQVSLFFYFCKMEEILFGFGHMAMALLHTESEHDCTQICKSVSERVAWVLQGDVQ